MMTMQTVKVSLDDIEAMSDDLNTAVRLASEGKSAMLYEHIMSVRDALEELLPAERRMAEAPAEAA